MHEDLFYTPATELARLIREKAVSPVEVVDAVLERMAALQPTLNCWVTVTDDLAREAARAAEAAVMRGDTLGPLHGVPIGIKDFNDTAGVRTTFGSPILADNVPAADAPVVARVKAAGVIMLGKTTGPDLGWKALGDSPLTGITRNPWHTAHTTGGSSAGAAAQVASGQGPLALGSDGAGSIRVPASFCGIYGFKPTFGRVPMPHGPVHHLAHNGPMARTVADAALLLQAIAGQSESDPTTLDAVPADYPARLHEAPPGHRVAWSPDLGYARVEPEVAAICAEAVQGFRDAGYTVDEVNPGWSDPLPTLHKLWLASYAARVEPHLDAFRERLDPALVAMVEEGLAQGPLDFVKAQLARQTFHDQVTAFFGRYDFLLTPSVAVPALPEGQLMPDGWAPHPWDWFRWAPFSYPFNMTGQPAATLPAGFTGDGLPVGLQVVGRRLDDLGVLQASAAFEQARPWARHRPRL